jgi:hypothetical protein
MVIPMNRLIIDIGSVGLSGNENSVSVRLSVCEVMVVWCFQHHIEITKNR